MALVSKNTLYTYFETGDKPTEQQFHNFIESLRSELDKIEAGDLADELMTLINDAAKGSSRVAILPAGVRQWDSKEGYYIQNVLVIGGHVDEYYNSIGTSEDGGEILEHEFVTDYFGNFPIAHYSKEDETLYFSETDEDAIIKILYIIT